MAWRREDTVSLDRGTIVARPVALEEARELLLKLARPGPPEEVPVEACLGRVAAETLEGGLKGYDVRLDAGVQIDSRWLFRLAAAGHDRVVVYPVPRVALLTTGGDVVDQAIRPLPFGKVYDVNRHVLAAAVVGIGGKVVFSHRVAGGPGRVARAIADAAADSDVVVTTGGVSVGDNDYLPRALRLLQAEVLFYRVACKPGAPTMAAVYRGKPVVCLSGNPAAALMGFEHIARPLLLRLAGRRDWARPVVQGRIAGGYAKPSPIRRFLRARACQRRGEWWAEPLPEQRAGFLASLHEHDCLVDVPAGSGPLRPGERVRIVLLERGERRAERETAMMPGGTGVWGAM